LALVLVTGYGGFLGRSICRQLLAAGHRVRGLARQSYPELQALGVDARQGDATRWEDCSTAVQGVDAIIHTAAIAGVWGPRSEFEIINVTATDNLLRAAVETRAQAFVYCSSPSVTFDGCPQRNIDETAPYPTRWLCDYPRTKAIAEQRVLQLGREHPSLLTCALRPHLIWGPGDPHLIPRLIAKCRTGRLRCVGSGTNLIDTVHVEAAAAAHLLALEKLLQSDRQVSGRVFFVTDGDPLPCWEWISQLLRHAGLTPPRGRVPLALAYRLGHALELVYAAGRIASEPPMTRFVAAQLGVDHYFSIEAAQNLLGYRPLGNRWQKLGEMEAWLKKLAE
jgi:nucleoside-diphosphate-sugar epimerase